MQSLLLLSLRCVKFELVVAEKVREHQLQFVLFWTLMVLHLYVLAKDN